MKNKFFYCKKCLTTSLRPNSSFVDGVCTPCNSSEPINKIEIQLKRQRQLAFLRSEIKINRAKMGNVSHDSIVGVSGGKDSLRQAMWVRDKLQLNPLLVCVRYPPKQMSKTGAENFKNLIEKGFDIITVDPAPNSSRLLTKKTFLEFGNVSKATELALHFGVPRIANNMKINQIFWGENPATQVGDQAVMGANEVDGSNHRKLNTLVEGGTNWIDVCKIKKEFYLFPKYNKNIKLYYLGPVWEDWSADRNASYSIYNGFSPSENTVDQTGDLTEASMVDEEFTNINMMIKYYKFGFGRATDYLNEQIRNKKISREKAIAIAEKYDGVVSDEIINLFCRYIEIQVEDFWETVNRYTNKDLFTITSIYERPIRRFKVGYPILNE